MALLWPASGFSREARFHADTLLYAGVLVLLLLRLAAAGAGVWPAMTGILLLAGALLGSKVRFWSRHSYAVNVHMALLALFLLLAAMLYPLQGYDARALWFHHGKIFFLFPGEAGLDYLRGIGHADYPKMLAALSAHIAAFFGFWSDWAVKFSVFILILPPLLTALRLPLAYVLTALLFSLHATRLLTSGYMDALLALYAVVMACSWTEAVFRDENKPLPRKEAVTLAILSGAVLLNLKNEGLVLAGIFALLALAHAVFAGKRGSRTRVAFSASDFALAALAAAPFVYWKILSFHFSLSNDIFGNGQLPFLRQLSERLAHPAQSWLIFKKLVVPEMLPLAVFYALMYAWSSKLPEARRKSLFAFALAALYGAALFCVYLGTPCDLTWHLDTSADRVDKPCVALLALAALYLLSAQLRAGGLLEKFHLAEPATPPKPSASFTTLSQE
ncbi:MAG: hypothetical protein PHP45_06460 [Elusimicrobiales bacterium]|nr:hypothetical protein [Elusimicrobiales bacterium]